MEDSDRNRDDRTVELRIPPGGLPPKSGGNGPAPLPSNATDGQDTLIAPRPSVNPIFPGSTSLESRLPQGVTSQRPSPALDPIARGNVSRLAKWGLLVCILLAFAALPAALYNYTAKANNQSPFSDQFYLANAVMAAILASVIATGIPRVILPGIFGKWSDASEAFRDWLIVGVISGLLYGGMIAFVKKAMPTVEMDSFPQWIMYRLPLVAVSSLIAFFIGRAVAIKQDAILGGGLVGALWQIPLQIALVTLLVRPFELGLINFIGSSRMIPGLLFTGAVLCGAAALGIIVWATSADASLMALRSRGRTGVDDGGAIDMTLTIIGGRESGKTVLLAAAFYEWSTQSIGNLRITPSEEAQHADHRSDISNLEWVAKELYVDNQFPVGTVSTQNLPFDLWLDNEKIAKFTFLDYPGGAIAGNVANRKFVEQFYERVEDTDGVILIADMSYVRRAQKEQDWLDVRNAYREVMRRIVARNGKRRVIPVALVLTKCDEYVDPNTGHIDMSAVQEGLENFEYDKLEPEWRDLAKSQGPGFAEFSTWMTSAITYSQPQMGRDGLPDYTKPFIIAPPPPPIKPTGCASPLLWMCAKVMRWNFTIYSDIRRFVMGASPKVRKRVDAILEMERVSEERRGKA